MPVQNLHTTSLTFLGFILLIFAKLWVYLKNKTKKIAELGGTVKKILEAFYRSCAACRGITA